MAVLACLLYVLFLVLVALAMSGFQWLSQGRLEPPHETARWESDAQFLKSLGIRPD